MTTSSAAYAVLRSLLEANIPANPETGGPAISLRWRGEDGGPLPDVPAPFFFTMFDASRSGVIEVGGGRGANRHRNPSSADVFIFVPNGWGLAPPTTLAESVATIFRPINQSGVVVESATVYPGGPGSELSIPDMPSEVGNYMWSAVGIEFYFDLIG